MYCSGLSLQEECIERIARSVPYELYNANAHPSNLMFALRLSGATILGNPLFRDVTTIDMILALNLKLTIPRLGTNDNLTSACSRISRSHPEGRSPATGCQPYIPRTIR